MSRILNGEEYFWKRTRERRNVVKTRYGVSMSVTSGLGGLWRGGMEVVAAGGRAEAGLRLGEFVNTKCGFHNLHSLAILKVSSGGMRARKLSSEYVGMISVNWADVLGIENIVGGLTNQKTVWYSGRSCFCWPCKWSRRDGFEICQMNN